eukprot:6311574-Ditylum_brightwellii.AAC.1
MANADAPMRENFDRTLQLKVLFTQMDKVQDLATAGENTYSDAQLTNIAYKLIFSTSVQNEACKEWIHLTPAGQMWAAFKPNFTAAHRMLHEMQTLAARAGYTANYIYKDQVNKQTAEALAQLAEAASSVRATVADLASTNTQLMEQ